MPEEQPIQTPQPRLKVDRPLDDTNWPKILLATLAGLALFTIATYTGYWYVARQSQLAESQVERGNLYASTEYGFSVVVPDGWSYKLSQEKVLDTTLVVELISPNRRIRIPIGVTEKSWDLVKSDVRKNFKPEAIEETMLAGQPALKVVSQEKEINPGYIFRIKHPMREDTVIQGVAAFLKGDDLKIFHESVETVLNSLKFN